MTQDQYLKILGLEGEASIIQIKKAYRIKARRYHPDLNKQKDAKDIFIAINEAYEYLTELHYAKKSSDELYSQRVKAWQEYRRKEAIKNAQSYAKAKFGDFSKSNIYRTSLVLNKIQIIINMLVSVFIITMAVFGYIIRLNMVAEGYDPPSIYGFLGFLLIGGIFFTVSLAHILAYYQNKKSIESNEKNK